STPRKSYGKGLVKKFPLKVKEKVSSNPNQRGKSQIPRASPNSGYEFQDASDSALNRPDEEDNYDNNSSDEFEISNVSPLEDASEKLNNNNADVKDSELNLEEINFSPINPFEESLDDHSETKQEDELDSLKNNEALVEEEPPVEQFNATLDPASELKFEIENNQQEQVRILPDLGSYESITEQSIFEEVYDAAANTLAEFIKVIELTVLDASRSFRVAPIKIGFYADGTEPKLYSGTRNLDNSKFSEFVESGYYMLENCYPHIEEHLQTIFPCSEVTCVAGEDCSTIVISKFMNSMAVLRHLKKRRIG
ncbi:7049_t:CDS:2, partial [Acaulospora morrowiae]